MFKGLFFFFCQCMNIKEKYISLYNAIKIRKTIALRMLCVINKCDYIYPYVDK